MKTVSEVKTLLDEEIAKWSYIAVEAITYTARREAMVKSAILQDFRKKAFGK